MTDLRKEKRFPESKSDPKTTHFSVKKLALLVFGVVLSVSLLATAVYFYHISVDAGKAGRPSRPVEIPLYEPPSDAPVDEHLMASLLSIADEPTEFVPKTEKEMDDEFNQKWNVIYQKQVDIEAHSNAFDPEAELKFVGFRNRTDNSCFFNSTIQVLYRSRTFRRILAGCKTEEAKPLAALFHLMDISAHFSIIGPLTRGVPWQDLMDKHQHNPNEVITKIYEALDSPEALLLTLKQTVIDHLDNTNSEQLQIEIPMAVRILRPDMSVSEMIQATLAEEDLGDFRSIRREIQNLPQILQITTTPYDQTLNSVKWFVDPEREITVSENVRYRLIGFAFRTGKINGSGHFVAFLPQDDGPNYLGFNDMRVNIYTPEHIKEMHGFSNMFIYERI